MVGEAFAASRSAAGSPVIRWRTCRHVCDTLAAQHHFIEDTGLTAWPDGTQRGKLSVSAHALPAGPVRAVREHSAARQLHRRIGARLQAGYGARAAEIAAQLAVHFERWGEIQRAVHYLAAGGGQGRRDGMRITKRSQPSRKGWRCWRRYRTARADPARAGSAAHPGGAVDGSAGHGISRGGTSYSRAHVLCQQVGETPHHFRVLSGLVMFHTAQGRLRTGQSIRPAALRSGAPPARSSPGVREGHCFVGVSPSIVATSSRPVTHLEQSLRALRCPAAFHLHLCRVGSHPRIASLVWLVRALWVLGYADQAQQCSQEALALARQIGHTPSLGVCGIYAHHALPVPPGRAQPLTPMPTP